VFCSERLEYPNRASRCSLRRPTWRKPKPMKIGGGPPERVRSLIDQPLARGLPSVGRQSAARAVLKRQSVVMPIVCGAASERKKD
jgi:hypothetical protein